jgi:hypothetical protein
MALKTRSSLRKEARKVRGVGGARGEERSQEAASEHGLRQAESTPTVLDLEEQTGGKAQ